MILCCGEALIDMLPRSLPTGEQAYLPVSGGAAFNTAIALGRLGEDVGLFSALSLDPFGDSLIATLQASQVEVALCLRSLQPTTLAFVQFVGGEAQYFFFDENSAGRSLRADILPVLDAGIDALHFGGISLIGEPCGSAYERLMMDNQDKLLSLDPNIRANFILDQRAHRQRIARMTALADIVKVSVEDLAWIAPSETEEAVVTRWLSGATRVVLVTRGAQGASAYLSGERFDVAAVETEVVDTVGSGDAFDAGLLAGLRRAGLLDKAALAAASSAELAPAFAFAASVAAATCAKAGANPPWRCELGL